MRESTLGFQTWISNPGQTSPEVQNRGISSPTKRTCLPQKFIKNKKRPLLYCTFTGEEVFPQRVSRVTVTAETIRLVSAVMFADPVTEV